MILHDVPILQSFTENTDIGEWDKVTVMQTIHHWIVFVEPADRGKCVKY